MKTAKASIGRALDQPDPRIRFYLFHGPDEAQSRGFGERLLKGLGADKSAVASATLRSDPALLADEAGAIGLFGGRRALWIEPAGEEIEQAVTALLEAPACESPAIAIAGALRRTSALLKLAEGHPLALSHISYVPDAQEAEAMVVDLARAEGLRPAHGVARRIAAAAGNDRAVIAQELAKLAIYLDADAERPAELDHDALDAIGADSTEGDLPRLADLALAGDIRALADELSALSTSGRESVPVIRSLQRRLLMLLPLRARVEEGQPVDAVLTSMGKALFWKDKPVVARMLRSWDAAGLARIADRVGRLERDLMLSAAPKAESVGEELVAIARQARRR